VLKTYRIALTTTVLATGLAGVSLMTAFAQKESVPVNQDRVALGTDEVKQLVELMDADKSGKVSKAEYMAFFSAEFDRLDKDHSGELDVKELEKSLMRPAARVKVSR
jgi:Ca2+-binding EF-hand superfamily protein